MSDLVLKVMLPALVSSALLTLIIILVIKGIKKKNPELGKKIEDFLKEF